MPILDRRSNAHPAVPGCVTGDRGTVSGKLIDQWLMDYPAAEQRNIDKGDITPQVAEN